MIIGLDTFDSVYLTLVQSNSNSKIMEIFIMELVRNLIAKELTGAKIQSLCWITRPIINHQPP